MSRDVARVARAFSDHREAMERARASVDKFAEEIRSGVYMVRDDDGRYHSGIDIPKFVFDPAGFDEWVDTIEPLPNIGTDTDV